MNSAPKGGGGYTHQKSLEYDDRLQTLTHTFSLSPSLFMKICLNYHMNPA
jgi:hypothetical protein